MTVKDTQEFEVTKAVAAVVPLGESTLDVYMLPNGEKRLGIEGTGIALGYTERWFYNRTKRKSKWLEGLKRTGFNGAQKSLDIIRLLVRCQRCRHSLLLSVYQGYGL